MASECKRCRCSLCFFAEVIDGVVWVLAVTALVLSIHCAVKFMVLEQQQTQGGKP